MTQRYLVTGAQGFVGRYMVDCLQNHFERATVLGIGRSPRQNSHFLHSLTCGTNRVQAPLPECLTPGSRYRYLQVGSSGDDLANIICDFRPTAVIHLAASLRGVTDEIIVQNNLQSTASLVNALLASGIKLETFLLASSGGVYGKQEKQPIQEDASVSPLDFYAQSKFACEEIVRDFAVKSATPMAIARIFNVLGPGQDELHVAGRFVSQIGTILGHGSPPVVRTGGLESTRDFLDVRDVCSALACILEHNHEGIYNVGSGTETKIADLLSLFAHCAGLADAIRIETDATRTDPIPRHVAETDRITSLGFKPRHALARSCCDMLTYHQRFIHSLCGP